jgi:AAA ATPase domain/Bacterial regulatory protein, Fis family
MLQLPEHELAGPTSARSALGSLDNAMREHLAAALEQTGWNISRTASLLGISRNTVRARARKFGLQTDAETTVVPLKAEPTPTPLPQPATVPSPPIVAPITIRWGTRRITLLRVILLTAEDADTASDMSRALEILVDKVQSFGGHVEELSQRGIGASFGLDPAEDAPRRAAHAAMAIQRAIERVHFTEDRRVTVKIGIHAGDALIGQSADRVEIDADAKRALWNQLDSLLVQADGSGILVSTPVAQFLERRFSLTSRGAPGGTGLAYLVPGRERPGLAPEGHMAVFVGRRQELALLKSRLESARMGHGQIVGIIGEAGIGKSRLLYEFRQSLRGERVIYLEGHCLSHGTGIPYLPVLQILKHAWRLSDADSPARIKHKVRTGLERLQMEAAESLPYLLHFLGVKGETDELALLSSDTIRTRTLEILRQLCIYASRQRPLVIAVKDVHWIDAASKALGPMVQSLPGFRLLVILTCRAGYQPLWADTSHMTQIALQPVNSEDSLSILGRLLPSAAVSEPVTQLILSKAEGNPFFLEELARTVREQGSLSTTLALPDTVQEVLLARINRLPDQERLVLQSAAVIGKTVALDVLRTIVDLPEQTLSMILGELRAADFLYDSTSGPEIEYSFKHALTHEVAYGSLEVRRRRDLHARIAQAIEQLYPDRLPT